MKLRLCLRSKAVPVTQLDGKRLAEAHADMRRHGHAPHGSARAEKAARLLHEMCVEHLEYAVVRFHGRIERQCDLLARLRRRTGATLLVADIRHRRRLPAADLDPEIQLISLGQIARELQLHAPRRPVVFEDAPNKKASIVRPGIAHHRAPRTLL